MLDALKEHLQKHYRLAADADEVAAKQHGRQLVREKKLTLEQYGALCAGKRLGPLGALPNGIAHGIDFRCVNWNGTEYHFTAAQAACVKLWWEHSKQGTPDISDDALLEATETSSRLRALFRDHPAWGAMIVEGATKGTHRLARPQEKVA